MKRKTICILCALLTIGSMTVNGVYADTYEENITFRSESSPITTRRYMEILDNNPNLSISNRNAKVTSNVNLLGNYRCTIDVTLQRSSNQTTWTNVKTWENDGKWNGLVTFSYNYTVAPNLYYRVQVEVTVYNANGSELEKDTKYSSIIRCT